MSVLKEISKLKKTAKYIKYQKKYNEEQRKLREIESLQKEEEYFSKNEKKNVIYYHEAIRKKNKIMTKCFKRKQLCTKMKDEVYQLYFLK